MFNAGVFACGLILRRMSACSQDTFDEWFFRTSYQILQD